MTTSRPATWRGFIAWLSWISSNCLRILFRNVSPWEQVNLSTGSIHQTAKTVGLCQHKMQCQCANHFQDTNASLQAGHQHNLLQRHCLNLRCVHKTNWWHGRSSCATPWEMRGNRWIVKGPFIRVVAVLCAIGGHRGIKTSSYLQKCVYSNWKLWKLKNIQVFEKLCRHRLQTSPNNWKHQREKDMEIKGPAPPETDSSPSFRSFQWLLLPTSISCALGPSTCWIHNDGKMQVSTVWR